MIDHEHPTGGNSADDSSGSNPAGIDLKPTAPRAGLLDGRRKFLIGSVGLSAVAATLASRPALAGGQTGCGQITALCSPTHSHVSMSGGSCGSGKHCDFWTQNCQSWPNSCQPSHPFSKWFGNVQFTGCHQTLQQAIASAYIVTNIPNNKNSKTNNNNNNNNNNQSHTYNPSCDANNLAAWIAVGMLNADCGRIGYSNSQQFANACCTALRSRCTPNIETLLCQTISSMCQDRSTQGAWGGSPHSMWSDYSQNS